MPTYKIKNIPGLDGLHVVGTITLADGLVGVNELVNANITAGDRLLRFPIPAATLYIDASHLEECDDISTREFASDNPYGKHFSESKIDRDDVTVTYASYEKAVTVNIWDKKANKTIYAANFFKNQTQVLWVLDDARKDDDIEDIIFQLKDLES